MCIRDRLIAIPDIRTYSNSGLSSTVNYTNWHDSLVLFRAMPLWISLSLIGLGLSLVLHRSLRRFGEGVARRIRRIPYEFKYVLGILLSIAAAGSLLDGYAIAYSSILTEGNPWVMAILFWLSVLGLYWDLKYNGFKTFRVNIPSVIFSLVRRYNLQFPFQQKIRRQFLTSLLVAIFLGILAFLSAALALMTSSGFFVLVGMGLAVLAVALAVSYTHLDVYKRQAPHRQRGGGRGGLRHPPDGGDRKHLHPLGRLRPPVADRPAGPRRLHRPPALRRL